MKSPSLVYVIKQRHNAQTGTYYVSLGPITKEDLKAARKSNPVYGNNTYHSFTTKEEYDAELHRLKAAGDSVQ